MVKIMENPINPWMIGGEKTQFLETPKRGSQGEKIQPTPTSEKIIRSERREFLPPPSAEPQ